MQRENKLTSEDWNAICFSLASAVKYMHLNVKVISLIYFSGYIVWARCKKPLKTLLLILVSTHEFGLICMFVIAYFRCTLNSFFLLVALLVMLMSRKFSECLWSSNSTVYFIAGFCLFSISKNLFAWNLS